MVVHANSPQRQRKASKLASEEKTKEKPAKDENGNTEEQVQDSTEMEDTAVYAVVQKPNRANKPTATVNPVKPQKPKNTRELESSSEEEEEQPEVPAVGERDKPKITPKPNSK